jgi:hypothetical protein
MRRHLLQWQWTLYPDGHRDRTNLILHLATVPLFMAGTLALGLAAWLSLWLLAAGPAAMMTAMALQGRGHKRETTAPVAFNGPFDVLARIFAEQWITFPRYVASGGWMQAWRASRS